MLEKYPANDFEDKDALLNLYGTFWSSDFTNGLFKDIIVYRGQLELQTRRDIDTLLKCLSRETMPLFRRVLLQPIVLTASDRIKDDNIWPLPQGLAMVGVLADQMLKPGRIWLYGIDYLIDEDGISFVNDPLEGADELVLWGYAADFDEQYLSQIWGAPLGLYHPSSEEFRELLCLTYDAIVGGTSRHILERMAALLYGGALAKEDGEVVELVSRDRRGQLVVTDKHVYRGHEAAQPVVLPGNTLYAGQPIFDTVRFCTLSKNDIPSPEELRGITIPAELLGVSAPLTFPNTIMSAGGLLPVLGDQRAVSELHVMLEDRQAQFGQHVNPMAFLIMSVLHSNTLLCILTNPRTPPGLAWIDKARFLRQLTPPHQYLLCTEQKPVGILAAP